MLVAALWEIKKKQINPKLWILGFADFCGVNILIAADFKLPLCPDWPRGWGEGSVIQELGYSTPLRLSHLPMDTFCPPRGWSRYLGSNHVLRILLFACRRVEHDVVDGLYQLQLDHTLDEEAGKQFLIYIRW